MQRSWVKESLGLIQRRCDIINKENKRKKLYNNTHRLNTEGQTEKLCIFSNHWVIMDDKHFYKQKNNADGYHTYCIECNKIKAKVWAEANPEKMKLAKKKDKLKPHRRKQQSEWNRIARELGYDKKYQETHREKFREYSKNRVNKNHNISKSEWQECKKYFNNCCAYCGISEEEAKLTQNQYLHKEHVIYNGANDLSNCVPSCRKCNSQKWKFSLEEWYNSNNPNFNKERFDKILIWLNEDYKAYIKIDKQHTT